MHGGERTFVLVKVVSGCKEMPLSPCAFRLRHPRHPLLNVGTPVKAVLLPMEMCKIATGQRQLKLDARQTADMIKITAQRPEERSRCITKALNTDSKLPTDPVVQAFGMQVSPKMELVRRPSHGVRSHLVSGSEVGRQALR